MLRLPRVVKPSGVVLTSSIILLSAVGATSLLHSGSSRLRGGVDFITYDYSKHGQDWTAGTCASRDRQSPIDLPALLLTSIAEAGAGITNAANFSYRYNKIALPFVLQNTGRVYSADLSTMGYGGVAYDDAWYDLKAANLHVLSEHTWGGRRKPAELQLVHQRYDGDELLIVAVALDDAIQASPAPAPAASLVDVNVGPAPAPAADPNFNPVVQAFLRVALPPPASWVNVPATNSLDLNALFHGGDFLEYEGSMTAPPCTETVTWLVRARPLPASATQLKLLATGIAAMTAGGGNYREVMPVNGRAVAVRHAVFGDPLIPADLPAALPVLGPNAVAPVLAPGAVEMAREAREALRIANNASAYAKTLTWRLTENQRSAAEKLMLHDAAASVNTTAVFQAATEVAAGSVEQLTAAVAANARATAATAATAAMARIRAMAPSSTP